MIAAVHILTVRSLTWRNKRAPSIAANRRFRARPWDVTTKNNAQQERQTSFREWHQYILRSISHHRNPVYHVTFSSVALRGGAQWEHVVQSATTLLVRKL